MFRLSGAGTGANVDALTVPLFDIGYPDPHEMATRMIDELIEHVGSLEGAAGLEWVAARLGLALTDPDAPLEVRTAVVECLEARDGTQGALLLAAIVEVCPGAAAQMAEEGVSRLRQRGLQADLPSGLGEYELTGAQLEKRKRRDFYSFVLRRPGETSLEIGYFSIKRGEQRGVLYRGVLTKPMREDEANEMMDRIEDPDVDSTKAKSISAEQLAAALREASARTIEVEGNVEFELWFALRAIARALDVDFAVLPDARLYI